MNRIWVARMVAGLGFATLVFANADLRAQSARTSDRALLAQRERVAQATVTVPAKSCAGVVAVDQSHVLTAAHCVPFAMDRLSVRLRDRTTIEGEIEYLDRDADLAIIALDQPAGVEPLALSDRSSAAGDRVLFVGRVDRRSRPQVARVERTGRCPSLPSVNSALFTSVQAKPGDSGAPLVDEELRVVALIHGGASCHIAAPTLPLKNRLGPHTAHAPAVAQAPVENALPTNPNVDEPPAVKQYKAGPFVFEKLKSGYRMRWSFSFSFGDKATSGSKP